MLTRAHRREEGFLLIELLSAMVILGVFFGLFAEFSSMMTTRTDNITRQAYLSSLGRAALDTFSNQVESAMCNGTTQPVTQASATAVQFTTPDRMQPYNLQQVNYNVASGTLTRQVTKVGGPAGPVVSVVSSIQGSGTVFNYYDASGAPISAPVVSANLPKIARITATLTLVPQSSRGTGALTMQGSGAIRTWMSQQQCAS